MVKLVCGISLREDVLSELDQKRGLIPRSRYIEHLLKQKMEE